MPVKRMNYWQTPDGGLRLLATVVTGSGVKDQGRKGKADMAESSKTSQKSEKPNAGKTAMTQEEALQIYQQSLLNLQNTGITVVVIPEYWDNGEVYLGTLLKRVAINGKHLVMTGAINGNVESEPKPEKP